MKTLNKQVTLVPQYMNKFSCIGSECEDSCCSGWKVTIDQPTYKKYKKSRHIELKELFDKNIIRNRSNPSEADYAKIKLDKGGNCPFLSEEKLCRVQMNLGEENLSTTCTTYPRSNHLIDGIIERSLTLSCPEAARLALLEPNGIEFDEVENAVESNIFISKKFKGDSPANNGKPAQYFWELRFFTIQLLQNRNYSIEDRLVILGMFLKKVQEIISLNKVNDIPQIIGQYVKVIDEGSLRKELDNIPTQNRIQMKLTKAIIDRRFLDGVNSPRFIECLKESLMGMGYITNASMSEVTDKYNHAFETYYSPFFQEHEYIFENYLVNYVFKNLFPLGKKSVYDDYVMLVIHYSMIKLLLIGLSSYHNGLTTDIVIKLIQSFAKTVEHNGQFLTKVLDILKDEGYTSLAFMAILIKN